MPFLGGDIVELIKTVGYLGLFSLVFIESGVFFGCVLPGGTVIFTAGLLASQGFFNLYLLIPLLVAAAVLGDSTGFLFGSKTGRRIFSRENFLCFNKENLKRTEKFYEKYGSWAVSLERFVPIIRTFGPILAGIAHIHYGKFLRYDILGAIAWTIITVLLGYFIGASVPDIQAYILPFIVVVTLVTIFPILFQFPKKRN